MPTGYTADIYSGKNVTLKDYIMLCARQFGACITMRDDPLSVPIPEEFQPDDYHLKQIEKIEKQLQDLKDNPKNQKEWETEYQNIYEKAFKEHEKCELEKAKMKVRYENMIMEVSNWEPPTKDHHNLKEFALRQLKESMEFDTSTYPFEFPEMNEWVISKSTGSGLLKDLAYHKEQYAEEVTRCKKRNQWIKDLRDSLI